MTNDHERHRLDAEHQHYLDRMQVAIRKRLTSRGCSETDIERYLADLPAEPISVIVQRAMAMAMRRVQRSA